MYKVGLKVSKGEHTMFEILESDNEFENEFLREVAYMPCDQSIWILQRDDEYQFSTACSAMLRESKKAKTNNEFFRFRQTLLGLFGHYSFNG